MFASLRLAKSLIYASYSRATKKLEIEIKYHTSQDFCL